jgi:hypothetical protein
MKLSELSEGRFAKLVHSGAIVRVPVRAMTLTFLIGVCLIACVFYLCVLFRWGRDNK